MTAKKTLNWILVAFFVTFLLMIFSAAQAKAVVSETARSNYKIVNGVTETQMYVTNTTGGNVSIHVLKINKGSKVTLKASTPNYYKKKSTKKSRKKAVKNWKKKKTWKGANVLSQANAYNASKGVDGKVVAGINGDFYKGNVPIGNLIAEGNKLHKSKKEPFFAVLKNGTFDIRSKSGKTSDVKEAVSGRWLLKNGKASTASYFGEARQMIGVTANGDVIIVATDVLATCDGIGLTDGAAIMRDLGCVDALNLDGGGSTSFYTKRNNKGKLKYRNVTGEAAPRTVTSALLVVTTKKKTTPTITPLPSLKRAGTGITKTAEGVYQYRINGNLQTGFKTVNGTSYLFDSKGNGMTKTIKIGKAKYTYKKGKYNKSSDKKAGKVLVHYCGANNKGQNLIFAYQYKNKVLNIGKNPLIKKNNGKMKNWSNIRYVPWRHEIYAVKTVNVGSGVVNVGNNFLYVSKNPINANLKKKKSALKKVTLASSVKTIGNYAFYNHYKLKKITIPKKVSKIGKSAFAYQNGLKVTFKSKKPPKTGKNAFKKYKKKAKFKTPNTAKWKKYKKKYAK